jgi:hypothetical protein
VIDLGQLNHYSSWHSERFDEAFLFRGAGALVDYPEEGSRPGQLRYEFRGDSTVVQLDVAERRVFTADDFGGDESLALWAAGHITAVQADGVADAQIVLLGRHDLGAADFVL